MKKIYILIGALCIFLVILMIFFNSLKSYQKIKQELTPSPTPTQPISQKVETGGSKEKMLNIIKERPEYLIEARLRNETPIQGKLFIIDFDYGTNTFQVQLSAPYETSRKNFENWAKGQGLNDLSNFKIIQ